MALNTFSTNLPLQLTSFIGRQQEIAEVKRLLATTRLLTLTGSGGAGKTRLALQIASDLLDDPLPVLRHGERESNHQDDNSRRIFPDGVWLVELAPLTDPALVSQTIASLFGIQAIEDLPLLDALTLYVRSKKLLLVLDNCEHLLDACAKLTDQLLRACPHLQVLATSREALNLAGEITLRVPSLAVPDPSHLPAFDALAQIESVRLFIERAMMASPNFRLEANNALAIAQICQRLDGMPLAIELAAARVKTLGVEQIATRLDDRFRLLTGGNRMALPRQQTLRATIDWSHELLLNPERRLFQRLSVFAGGWTLETAEVVCAGDGIAENEILDLLSRLIDQSLVLLEEQSSGARYRFLETLRQYARERLIESGEIEKWQARHLEFFLKLAEQAELKLRTADQLQWFNRLEIEHDNIRAALRFALERNHVADALRLAAALWRFWNVRGYWTEGRQWLTSALAKSIARDAMRAKALYAFGMLCWFDQDHLSMRTPIEECLAIWRALDDKRGVAEALNALGMFYARSGNTILFDREMYAKSRALSEESLALRRKLGDPWDIAESLAYLGYANRDLGDPVTSRVLLEESLALWRELGDRWGIAWALLGLGFTAKVQGDYSQATTYFAEGYNAAEQLGERRIMMESLGQSAQIAEYQGDYVLALSCAEKQLKWAQSTSAPHRIIFARTELGQVAYLQRDYQEAVACWKEGLTIARALNRMSGVAGFLAYLGYATLAQGNLPQALDFFEDSLKLDIEASNNLAIARGLVAFGNVATVQGQDEIAARLFGAAEALAERIGKPLWRRDPQNSYERIVIFERDLYDRNLAALRAKLDQVVFAKWWAEGHTLTLDQAIAAAEKLMHIPASIKHTAGLTMREVELLRLLSNGLSNQQIANQLVVSRRTVDAHLRSIYGKLGVTTRSGAIHAATEQKII